jgi:hypothetical protein
MQSKQAASPGHLYVFCESAICLDTQQQQQQQQQHTALGVL